MEFYSVKHRKKVEVPDADIKKKTYNSKGDKGGSTRYAAVAKTVVEGSEVNLTKFINKETYDSLKVPEAD